MTHLYVSEHINHSTTKSTLYTTGVVKKLEHWLVAEGPLDGHIGAATKIPACSTLAVRQLR